nr:DEAD/DEAH box helicase family protein [Duncaniella freteri]
MELYDYQQDAVQKMKNGCILCGGVGSGKSRTALAYYYLQNDGEAGCLVGLEDYIPMGDPPKDLYIITTARKRDTLEWEGELSPFLLSTNSEHNLYRNKVVVDSWNNIKKYAEVTDAFFIFDEQRVVGSGAWVKSFLKIARRNQWILLSATPGDTWQDYIPVFIANGFYRNRTEFTREHIVYSRFSKFPKVDRYLNVGRLIRQRNDILVNMDFKRTTVSHHEDVFVKYNIEKYKDVARNRWNPYKDEPIINAGELCYVWRKIVNTDESRQVALLEIVEKHPRAIIFYNFDYELELLREMFLGRADCGDTGEFEMAEWNGHTHQPIPDAKSWVYLVQYNAGAEGWNCIKTDTIIFYSQNYSYKIMQQSAGRIDRLNTPYKDLYYYHLKTRSGIDLAISRALRDKKDFNESRYGKWIERRRNEK